MDSRLKAKWFVGLSLLASILFFLIQVHAEENVRMLDDLSDSQVPYVEVECTPDTSAGNVEIHFFVVPASSASQGEMRIQFYPPYTEYSVARQGTDVTLTVPALPVPYVRGEVQWYDGDSEKAPKFSTRTEEWGDEGCETGYRDSIDYLCDNWWIFIIAFLAVMSYRFFSGRAMDFQDYFDEFRGKK